MKRFWLGMPALLVGFCVATAAQTATQAQSAQHSANAAHHGTFTVELLKPLDSRKLKQGDPVEAKLTGGITLPSGAQVPRGARVIGHITEARARSKSDSESALGISFDKIVWSGNESLAIQGTLQAVAPNPNGDITTGGSAVDYGNSLKMETTNNSSAPNMQSSPVPLLNDDSTGVLGFKNMKLADGVITSTGKDLKLDSGTRMLLNVTMQ